MGNWVYNVTNKQQRIENLAKEYESLSKNPNADKARLTQIAKVIKANGENNRRNMTEWGRAFKIEADQLASKVESGNVSLAPLQDVVDAVKLSKKLDKRYTQIISQLKIR